MCGCSNYTKAIRFQSGLAKNHISAGSLGPLHCARDQLSLSNMSTFKVNDTVAVLGTQRALGLVNGGAVLWESPTPVNAWLFLHSDCPWAFCSHTLMWRSSVSGHCCGLSHAVASSVALESLFLLQLTDGQNSCCSI